ncbi:proton-conducting transporter transmembrane domain-containing protein [Roseovarius sp. B08]|uniref:proton-conducting transporter transmembrane domain-containing protein n=1 Tax=Roseovarius sp. B08 TaxID=3449223 RepID=UPI003EDB97C9
MAYSTISQMGLMVMIVGAGGRPCETVPYFALHQGLAKCALFLFVACLRQTEGHDKPGP